MITKIISGGQIGADIGGLLAAKKAGIETGGWMPHGFKTLEGNKPEYADEFGMFHTNSPDYPARTYKNVQWADGTVRFAYNFHSPGELCTAKATKKYKKPCFDVIMHQDVYGWEMIPDYTSLASWIENESILILNVSGNAGNHIEFAVEEYLLGAFGCLGI